MFEDVAASSHAWAGHPAQFAEMLRLARERVAFHGVVEVVHHHGLGEECNDGCTLLRAGEISVAEPS
jgi:hypothetical protein